MFFDHLTLTTSCFLITLASLGTTKYCSTYLKNQQCHKADCMYLHELAEEEASFTKEEMQVITMDTTKHCYLVDVTQLLKIKETGKSHENGLILIK